MNAENPDVGISKVTKSNATPWRVAALSVAVLGCGHVAAAQEAQKMFIEGDIVRGNTPNGNTGPVCVLANQFKRKENVIFLGPPGVGKTHLAISLAIAAEIGRAHV